MTYDDFFSFQYVKKCLNLFFFSINHFCLLFIFFNRVIMLKVVLLFFFPGISLILYSVSN